MENKKEQLAALQTLTTASEMYLTTLDAIARPATTLYLQHAISVLVTALDLNETHATDEVEAPGDA